MLIGFDDTTLPSSVGDLQRSTADAFVAIQAGWDKYHNPDGSHKTLPDLGVTGNSEIGGSLTTTGARVFTDALSTTLTANVNNLKQADGRPYDTPILRISTAADRTITGMVPAYPLAFQRIYILNVSNFFITLAHASSSSSVGNRFALPGSVDAVLRPNERAEMLYDPNDALWRVAVYGGRVARTQYVEFVVPAGDDEVDVTISAVDVARAFPVPAGAATPGTFDDARYKVINSTTARIYVSTDASNIRTFACTIVEI